jgi:hypothetical protein
MTQSEDLTDPNSNNNHDAIKILLDHHSVRTAHHRSQIQSKEGLQSTESHQGQAARCEEIHGNHAR